VGNLRREVLFAHEAGSSLRAIAAVLEVAPETVRKIVRQEGENRERVRARLDLPIAALTVDDHKRTLAARRRVAKEWRLSVQDMDR
jgi:hypothetical protein